MTEISFARSFLSALDARPVRISSDHVADQKKLTGGIAYTLPKYSQSPPYAPKSDTIAPKDGVAQADVADAVSISLKNSKSPTHSMELSLSAKDTSVYDLKAAYASRFSVPEGKIKVLDMGTKRPISDSKLVEEFVQDGKAEFGIMLIGATPTMPDSEAPAGANIAGSSRVEDKSKDVEMKDADELVDVLETKEFWNDLESWLGSRLEDKKKAKSLAQVFKQAVAR